MVAAVALSPVDVLYCRGCAKAGSGGVPETSAFENVV